MTIFVDPYHTSMGRITDLTRTTQKLIESTIRDPLKGTNLGLRTDRGAVPVFITGCRDSERDVPPFAHPIFAKKSNGNPYLFVDMRQFVQAQSSLEDISKGIRRQDQYDFALLRANLSLTWVIGESSRMRWPLALGGDVYAQTIAQLVGREFVLDWTDQLKVQVIALGFYYSLFEEGAVNYAENSDLRSMVARRFSTVWKDSLGMPMHAVEELLKKVPPMGNLKEFCAAVVEVVDSSRLRPNPKSPAKFNEVVLLQLIASVWYSHNSPSVLATALEHPPTWLAILYFCLTYNNFRKQTLGNVAQTLTRGGRGDEFSAELRRIVSDNQETQGLRPVMEYLDPTWSWGSLD